MKFLEGCDVTIYTSADPQADFVTLPSMRSTHLRAARPIADELSKGQKLEHGAMTDIFLEHAIRESYGIDKCVLIPHWDRKPRIAKMARHENAELFASS